MGDLLGLAVYNPAILSDEAFLASFVAHGELVERLLGRLREIGSDGLASHHLILGQRGMGKTSLLRRLAIGVRDDPVLSDVLLPLSFREEQYNVHNLHVFWCNCLDAIGDWYEGSGQPEQAAAVDRDLAQLTSGKPDPEGDAALEVFRRRGRQEGRRPLLLLDNLDIILAGLSRHQWSLRRVLQQAGGIVVVGCAGGYLEATADREAAFYDFFQITVLKRLGQDELLTCLHRLANTRGDQGFKVKTLLDTDPGRIRTLCDLTGGNPRTLTLLYLLLELDSNGDVLGDLERLLDQVTLLYKARVEDLAPQARVVLDALALAWNPVIAADLAATTGLATATVSTQLDRLQKDGLVEKVNISTSNRAAFQLSERFFNIWYLMRHGPRRQRMRLRWLTEFLRGFYTPGQLRDRATGLNLLLRTGRFTEQETAYREAIGRNPGDAPAWAGLGNLLSHLSSRYSEAEMAYRRAIELDPASGPYRLYLGRLMVCCLGRYEEAERIYRDALRRNPSNAALWQALGYLLLYFLNEVDEAENAYRKALMIDSEDLLAFSNLLAVNLIQPGHQDEAEGNFDAVIARHPDEGADLLRAIRAIAQDNFGSAVDSFEAALSSRQVDLFSLHQGFVLLFLRQTAQRGYGDRLFAALAERGIADRHWPLVVAFDAYLHGEARLMDVNPEVRGVARSIYDWLDAPRRQPPSPAELAQ